MKHFIDFGAKESIAVGIFTALILFLHLSLLMILHLLPGALILFKEAFVALLTGPVYVLLLIKVPRRGVFTVCGLATALTYCLFGFFTVGALTAVGGILADYIASRRSFGAFAFNCTAYAVFSVAKAVGTYIPFYLWGDSFVESLRASGRGSPEFIEIFTTNLTLTMGLAVIAANVLCAILGFALGRRMLKKHFVRAGIA